MKGGLYAAWHSRCNHFCLAAFFVQSFFRLDGPTPRTLSLSLAHNKYPSLSRAHNKYPCSVGSTVFPYCISSNRSQDASKDKVIIIKHQQYAAPLALEMIIRHNERNKVGCTTSLGP